MAGIGFTLKRMMEQGDYSGLVRASLAGVFIVAGPWILSVVTMALLGPVGQEVTGALVTLYASGLILFGGVHFIITRIVADQVYREDKAKAAATVCLWSVLVGSFSALLGVITAPALTFPSPGEGLFRIAWILTAVSVNIVWIMMIYASLLKWYLSLTLVYALGMGVVFLLSGQFMSQWGPAGVLMAFGFGHVVIILVLGILIRLDIKPDFRGYKLRDDGSYFLRYAGLFGAGMVYNLALWADKILVWIWDGEPVPGTFFRFHPVYDTPMFLANLTIIPGLVFFVASLETVFFLQLRTFLRVLEGGTYLKIQTAKNRLRRETRRQLWGLILLQGMLTGVLALSSGGISRFILGGADEGPLWRALGGTAAQLLFFSLSNLLFYLECYREVLSLAALYVLVSLVITAGFLAMGSGLALGGGFLAGGIAASLLAWWTLETRLNTLDQLVLVRSAGY